VNSDGMPRATGDTSRRKRRESVAEKNEKETGIMIKKKRERSPTCKEWAGAALSQSMMHVPYDAPSAMCRSAM